MMRLFSTLSLAAMIMLLATGTESVYAQQGSSSGGSGTQTTAATAAAQPCKASEAYRQLDFWVGELEVQGPKGKVVGASSVQLILNDCVVFENWTGAGGHTGKSFNLYDATEHKWKQIWVDDHGGMLQFTGEFKDGAMRYAGESVARNGQPVMDRLTFFPLPEGRVRQLWEQSADKGKTWTTVFDGTYIKKK